MKISQEEPAALQEIGYLDNIESRKVYYGLSMLKSIPPIYSQYNPKWKQNHLKKSEICLNSYC